MFLDATYVHVRDDALGGFEEVAAGDDPLVVLVDGKPARAKQRGRLAFARTDLHLSWAITTDRAAALVLERTCLDALADLSLSNRMRQRALTPGPCAAS